MDHTLENQNRYRRKADRLSSNLPIITLLFIAALTVINGSAGPTAAVYASPLQSFQTAQQLANSKTGELAGQQVLKLTITGNQALPLHAITRNISTREGRFFDPDLLQFDVDKLWRMPEIKRVNGPFIQETPDGIIVTIDVVERKVIRSIQFIGNRGLSDRDLRKQSSLEEGAPLDLNAVSMAKVKIEDHYKEKGYPRTQVEIMEGEHIELGDVVFLIHEDQQQKIWNVKFEGNDFVSDARLKTLIQSKPGILKLVGGLAKRTEIDQDIVRLANYYKSFGYFNCRIGRELEESNDGRWMSVRFIIDEGPRYKVRNVSFIGQDAYRDDQLNKLVSMKPDSKNMPNFNASKMNEDVVALRELYGSEGFVFAKVEAEPRFLEEPGMLDMVYKIDEGERYRVGQINVHIAGGGITKKEVVINRLSLKPGDWLNSNLLNATERRLGASQIFAGRQDPGGASAPKVVVRTPEMKKLEDVRRTSRGSSVTETRMR